MSELNGHDPVFIEDGYTVEGYVDPVKGLHGPLAFTFRPILSTERAKVLSKWVSAKEGEKLKLSDDEGNINLRAQTLVNQLASWEIRNSAGDVVGITTDTAKRLHPALLDKVFNRILGLDPRDDRQFHKADELEAADAKN